MGTDLNKLAQKHRLLQREGKKRKAVTMQMLHGDIATLYSSLQCVKSVRLNVALVALCVSIKV
jgi:hypothetical protein